ncbi:MAG: hypothetical protein JEZ07_15085 [Phycisphaerae bacterium]|nr:hypothetical protein [Phycisphaerae bacterium]
MDNNMIPAGYMAKRITGNSGHLQTKNVVDFYSVSNCISADFASYVDYWKHNGYWLFDSPEIILNLAEDNSIDMTGAKFFYYEIYGFEFNEDDELWHEYEPEKSFATDVKIPEDKTLEGFDIVTFSVGTSAECSPLSCNGLADEIKTNRHCLLSSLEQARQCLESGLFSNSEPGPFRIFAVYSVAPPEKIIPFEDVRPKWNWPAVVVCFVVGLLIQSVLLPCMCRDGSVKMGVAFVFDILITLRLGWAYFRKEKGKVWLFYAALCLLLGPIIEVGFRIFSSH